VKVLAIAALVAAATPAAADTVSRGALAMRGPDQIVLGRDASVTLRLGSSSNPVRLVTNVGAVSAPVVDGAEQLATFTPPADRRPQRALIAAIDAAGTIVDWITIPLAGQATMRVATDRRARVQVQVADIDFGPVDTGDDGIALVPIVVPPDTSHATTITTTTRGVRREKTVELGVLSTRLTLVVCSPRQVTVLAIRPTGAASDEAPELSVSRGQLGRLAPAGAGVFIASYAPTDWTQPAVISATFAREPSSASQCEVQFPPEPPSGVRIVADRDAFRAGSGPIRIRIELAYDAGHRALPVERVVVEPDTGTMTPPTRGAAAGWESVWTLPDRLAGRNRARVRVRIPRPGRPALAGELILPLITGTSAKIETTRPGRVAADGDGRIDIAVRVVDRWGNAIAAPSIEASARGEVLLVVDGESRRLEYTAPATRRGGGDLIEIVDRDSGLTTTARILFEPPRPRLQLAARIGVLSNLGGVGTTVASASADARLPLLRGRLVAGLLVAGYTTTLTTVAMTEQVSARLSAVPMLARLAYRTSRGRFDLWGGAGAGLALARTRLSSASSGTTASTTLSPAAIVYLGASRRLGPGAILIEGAYLHATISGPVDGRIGGVVATAGYAFEL